MVEEREHAIIMDEEKEQAFIMDEEREKAIRIINNLMRRENKLL